MNKNFIIDNDDLECEINLLLIHLYKRRMTLLMKKEKLKEGDLTYIDLNIKFIDHLRKYLLSLYI